MSSKASRSSLPALLGILILSSAGISKDTSKQLSTELKSKAFRLKTHENLFARPGFSKWNWERTVVFSADISIVGDEVSISGNKNWKSQYFVSGKQFVVSDLKVNGNTVEITMKGSVRNGSQLKLKFIGLDGFKSGFDAIFFGEGDDMERYENEVNRLLIGRYLEAQFDGIEMKEDEKLQLLQDLKLLSTSGKPEIVRQKEAVYALISLDKEDVSYNVLQVNKNQRISSTLDKTLRRAKSRITKPRSPYLKGYSISWEVFYHDPLGSSTRQQADTIELLAPVSVFEEYKDGALSVLETIQKSILKVNGEKYTLTDYQPIGTEVPN
jgi:hypothetical protein